MATIRRALTIAGSDSGGCAGIQADLKTFAALRVHGLSAITSVTAQNTRKVVQVTELPAASVEAQIKAVVDDIGVDAVKTGMLSSAAIIARVALCVSCYQLYPLVVDPVMVSTSGDCLLDPDAVETLKRELFPLASVITPNRAEAEALSGVSLESRSDLIEAAEALRSLGAKAVIIKGGHSPDPERAVDYLVDGSGLEELDAARLATPNTHGSGCTFAAAITAYLARGCQLREAARKAKTYVTAALEASYSIGSGPGPLGHFFESQ